MQIFKGIESFTNLGDTTVTVGSFDGVHSGHKSLIANLCRRANVRDQKSVVVSFSPHPRVTLSRAEGLSLLTSDIEKATLLEREGVDALLLIEFNREFSLLSYEDFLTEYLQQRVGMTELIAGFNHHMGHNGGGFDSLEQIAQKRNFSITMASEHNESGDKVSSTVIRDALMHADIDKANRLLAHPYIIIGMADEIGKVTIDEPLKLIPPMGVYRATIDGIATSIVIDPMQQIWCEERNKTVTIELLGNEK